jgi:hypothetical protein
MTRGSPPAPGDSYRTFQYAEFAPRKTSGMPASRAASTASRFAPAQYSSCPTETNAPARRRRPAPPSATSASVV